MLAELYGSCVGFRLMDDMPKAKNRSTRLGLLIDALKDVADDPDSIAGLAFAVVGTLEVGLRNLPRCNPEDLDDAVGGAC